MLARIHKQHDVGLGRVAHCMIMYLAYIDESNAALGRSRTVYVSCGFEVWQMTHKLCIHHVLFDSRVEACI